ncbi:MAG: AI-2E family transporter [Actinomycetota bacterium]|nr:AI-2E family transporter [Actinomycetota bacterium]
MDRVRRAGSIAWALVGLAVVIAIVAWLSVKVAVIFPPLILAGALVFILNPLISFLHRRRVPRAAGVGLTYLAFLGTVTLIGFVMLPAVRDQAENLSDNWPSIRLKMERWVDDRAESLKGTPLEFDRKRLDEAVTTNSDSVQKQLERVAKVGVQVFHVVLVLILAPIFAFYLLIDLPHLKRTAEGLIPPAARTEVMLVARRVNAAVGGFFRGQLAVAFIVGLLSSIGLRIIDLNFWLLIGMVAGIFNIIPLVGPYIGGVPALVIALTTREPITAVWVVAIMVAVQQIDNHFISPMVMHRVVKLHPVLVMLALLLGGTLGGFFGLLVAVPTAAVLKIVVGHLWRVHVLGEPLEVWKDEVEAEDSAGGRGFVKDVPAGDGDGEGAAPKESTAPVT